MKNIDRGNAPVVGVVGLGRLGRGIAACLLAHGFRVVGHVRPQRVFAEARAEIGAAIDELAQRSSPPARTRVTWADRYVEADSVSGLAECQFVIETVPEDLASKVAVFDEVESVVGTDVPIGTNTSGLPITLLQRGRRFPNRIIGMHWAYPSHATRFLEVIRGEATDKATYTAAMQLGRALGKDPVVVTRDVEGFIVNRIGYAMFREALWLLEQGVGDVETIDRACRNAMGLHAAVMGPFRWMDLTGVLGYARVMARLFPTLCNSDKIPKAMTQLVEEGADGARNGGGFYRYSVDQATEWEQRYRRHVWEIRAIHEREFPLEASGSGG